jgi:D-alanyl-D-alanine carboxypeptidase
MTTRNLADAVPHLQSVYATIKTVFEATLRTYELRPTCVYRTPAEQLVEFNAGRSALDGQTPATMSRHNSRPSHAIDIGIFNRADGSYLPDDPALYWIIGLLAQKHGLRWGGSWRNEDLPYTRKPKDPYHVELS